MMYVKEVEGRQVFSQCKVICLEYDHPPLVKGQWVSNPDSQLIYDEGWREYAPPVVPPAPLTEPEMEEVISAVKKMLASSTESLTDEEALEVAALYPTWSSKIDNEVSVGERLWYDGKLWKVIQAHTVQENWTPDVSASLFTEVSIEEWPEWRQPLGAQDAYMAGDKVSYNGSHYISDVDNNTWAPDVYGWHEV